MAILGDTYRVIASEGAVRIVGISGFDDLEFISQIPVASGGQEIVRADDGSL